MNYTDICDCIYKYETEPNLSTAEQKALAIVDDISQRSGIGHEWEQIESKIKNEIFTIWVKIIESHPQKNA